MVWSSLPPPPVQLRWGPPQSHSYQTACHPDGSFLLIDYQLAGKQHRSIINHFPWAAFVLCQELRCSPLDTDCGAGHDSWLSYLVIFCLPSLVPPHHHLPPVPSYLALTALTAVPAVMVGSHGGNATPIDRNLANQVGSDHFSWLWQKTGPVSNIHYGVAINLYLYYCSCRDQRRMIGSPLDPTVHTDQSTSVQILGLEYPGCSSSHLRENKQKYFCILPEALPVRIQRKMLYFSCRALGGGWCWSIEDKYHWRREVQEFITWTMDGPQVPLAESKLSKSNGILV